MAMHRWWHSSNDTPGTDLIWTCWSVNFGLSSASNIAASEVLRTWMHLLCIAQAFGLWSVYRSANSSGAGKLFTLRRRTFQV